MADLTAATARHRVLVVGGGFGGRDATRALADAPVDMTLVDRTNHRLFQPLLYQVAAGVLPAGLTAPALRGVVTKQKNAHAVPAEVTAEAPAATQAPARQEVG